MLTAFMLEFGMRRHAVVFCSVRLRPASGCPRSFSLVYHSSTTRLLSRDLARQALLFLCLFLLSFFVPPYFILLNYDKEREGTKEARK